MGNKKVAPALKATPAVFSGEKERDRKVRGMVVILAALALLALVLSVVLWGVMRSETALIQAAAQPVNVVVNPAIFIEPAAEVTSAEALPTAAEAIVAPEPVACQGTSQIPGWSDWMCGDSALIGATDADYPGYVFGPVTGILYIDPNHLDAHGYRDENGDGIGATLWPAESPSDGHDLPACASQIDVALGVMNQIVVDQGCVLAIGGDIEN